MGFWLLVQGVGMGGGTAKIYPPGLEYRCEDTSPGFRVLNTSPEYTVDNTSPEYRVIE